MDRNEGDKSTQSKPANNGDRSDLDPFEINFLPQFLEGRGPREPFVNSQGVVIGDHDYQSENSPLEQWSKETDPSVMSGDEWVHPFKDVGFHTTENKQIFEQGITPQSDIFMHPDKDVAYPAYNSPTDDDTGSNKGSANRGSKKK
ncbi:MAG: hypothetical protein K0S39_777 [Paenibacillus sp.]|jgi:hypothetical protein|nr:hypothetical protein [Paenibacillus sp.]